MKLIYCFLSVLILFFLCSSLKSNAQKLIINEILTSNKKTNYDGFGESDDWVELYNPHDTAIQIGGMFVTNDLSDPTKYCIPSTTTYWTSIAPKSYLLLWFDNDPEQGNRHMTFTLKKNKGLIAVYDADTNRIDCIKYQAQTPDVSIGRLSFFNGEKGYFFKPTPNEKNIKGLRITADSVKVEANIKSGFYTDSLDILLSTNSIGNIYYTLDGSVPTIISSKYEKPIKTVSTLVLRSILIRKNFIPSNITTNTYFINEKSTLSVLSLTTDPENLWNKKKGIYRKYEKRGWERPAFVEYFKKQNDSTFNLAFTKTVDIRIAGKTSRRQPKKSFAIFGNNNDGGKRIKYKIFDDKPINSFSSFWVRSDATSGRNVAELWVGERFKNELLYEINHEMKGNVDMQAYEPVLLFINGKYWGLYNLMERKGRNFIANNHEEYNVDILTAENTKVVRGKMEEYNDMIDYIRTHNPALDSVFSYMGNLMDMDSYIDYWIYETYSGAHDVGVNIRYWKSRTTGSKWRWISYDQDSWHTSDERSFSYFLDHSKVFLLSSLMQNLTFRNKFINRMCDFLNTGLSTKNVIKHVNSITERIAKEIPREKMRWQDTMLYIPKNQRINWIKDYAVHRPENIRQQMIDYFNLGGKCMEITIGTAKTNGCILLNSLEHKVLPWKGIYIENVPVVVEATPNEGFVFVRWKNRKLPRNPGIIALPKDISDFIPVFKRQKLVSSVK